MSTRPVGWGVSSAVLFLAAATGCGSGGGGGGGGTPGDTKRVHVVPHVLDTSGSISRVAVGDVNGDGVEDLLVHHPDQASVQVMLADVSVGTEPLFPRLRLHAVPYQSVGHVFVWDSAADLCVCDMDSDGCLDLVVAGGDANAVGVWHLDPVGRTRFTDPVIVTLDCPASRVAAGDVNGDGTADLVCLDESQGRVRLCTQSSSALRTFTVDASPPDIGACFGLMCCDLDRDGRLDLVTNRPAIDAVTIMPLSSPAGILSPRDHPSGLPTGRCMAVGDVDGDGALDVCVLAEGGRSVACFRQRTTQAGVFDVVPSPLSIAIDESGVHVSVPAVQRRGVVGGCGNGNYCPTSPQGAPVAGISIDEPGVHFTGLCVSQPGLALADLDRDGRLDLCARTADGTGDAAVCFGSHAVVGGFETGERVLTGGWAGPLCAVADLDDDGHLDLVGCSPAAHQVNPLYTAATAGGENPLYEGSSVRALPFPVADAALSDVDRDGRLDLVLATPTGVQCCYGGAGGFDQPVLLGLATPMNAVAAGDVNGDGWTDVVSVGTFTQSLLSAGPAGTPRTFDILSSAAIVGACRGIALGDVNGDGTCDLAAAFDSGAFVAEGVFGGFLSYEAIPSAVSDPRACAVADFDADGDLDVCVCGPDSCDVVLQESASPFVWSPAEPASFRGGVRVAVGDVNGDGRCDVCVSGEDGVLCALQDWTTRGAFLGSHALSTEECGGLTIGDLNRDGRMDLCFVETKTGDLRCRNGSPNDDSPFSLRLDGLPPGEPVIGTLTLTGDLDGDGASEVLTVCPNLGTPGATVRTFAPVSAP